MSAARHVAVAGDLRLEVLERVGAKVISLRRSEGSEWLAPAVRPLRTPPVPAGAWSDFDCSGWDECFPNIASDSELGLADHGDVWPLPWRVVTARDRITATVTVGHRYRLERELRLSDDAGIGTVTADYRVRAFEGDPLRWAWAQHLLLAADPTMRLLLPHPARVRVEVAFADRRPTSEVDWICPGGVLATDTRLDRAVGRAVKLWFEPPLPSVVAIVREHDWLAWRIDHSTTPHLGLWINLGGWGSRDAAPLAHVAVEPAFGAHDSYRRAQEDGAGPEVAGARTHRWRTVIQTAARDTAIPNHPCLTFNKL